MFGLSHSWTHIAASTGIMVDNRKIRTDPKSGEFLVEILDEDPRTDNPSISYKGKLKPTATSPPGITTGELELKLWDRNYSIEASTIEEVITMGGNNYIKKKNFE